MYARSVEDKTFTFDFAEGLIKNNLLIVDRETDSVWSQLHGRAIIGPMKGAPLSVIPSVQSTWAFWRERHPETRVMVLPNTEGSVYHYRGAPTGRSSPQPPTPEHDLSSLGFGLALGNESIWVSLSKLEGRVSPIQLELGGQQVEVFFDRDGLTAWAEDASGQLLPGVLAYQEGWFDFFPESLRLADRAP